MHTCFPFEEELVKVPTGHGRKYAIESLPAICLNPDAKRVATRVFVRVSSGFSTSITSSSEF